MQLVTIVTMQLVTIVQENSGLIKKVPITRSSYSARTQPIELTLQKLAKMVRDNVYT